MFNLEKEALIASGIDRKELIADYMGKLDCLYQKVLPRMAGLYDPIVKARVLFEFLWMEKPARYKSHGQYRLNDVIDAHISAETKGVGNCLGLTLLYNSLLRRIGIKAEALYMENAFGIGPHVLTLLQKKDRLVDVENILPNGFDYKGYLDNPCRTRWGDRELVADIFHSIGNECFENGNYIDALKNYNMSIRLNPDYQKAILNKAIVIDKIKS
ncbi:MAG: tetratricopeptide repeat protein [Pseudomonadota bacterium]